MAEKKPTEPFPGSVTGNRSGAGETEAEPEADQDRKPATAPFPGSPTGNASGAGAAEEDKKPR